MTETNQVGQRLEPGQLCYEQEGQITAVVDYGVTLKDALSGRPLPSSGLRFDVSAEGTVSGVVRGRFHSVDHLYMRPDGHTQLHILGSITTDDDARIALFEVGVGTPNPDGTFRLFKVVSLHTSFEKYAWVNPVALRAEGTADLGTGSLSVRGYVA